MTEETNHKSAPQRTERIGRYEILDHIATGGMGVIYKARDVDLDRFVALKILPPDLADQQTTLIRFQREARAAAQLRHDNIVSIFDVGEADGMYYIALEFVEGTDLQDYITRNCKLDPEEARQIMIQATRALVHAHEQGIVHRDIKPSNLMLTRKGNRLIVKLTDFGLAIRHENDAEFRITKDKTTVGTVDYMSPEQACDSRSADIRSDIYSLGCTFYHMLAGQAPFAKGTLPERIIHHMRTLPPDVRKFNKIVPEAFVVIINRMLAKKPDERYQTPSELLSDLEHPDQVAPPEKNGTSSGRTAKKREPTQVIDQTEVEATPEEPKQLKVSRLRKRTPGRNGEEPKVKDEAPDAAPENESQEHWPALAGPKKKEDDKPTPPWMIVAGASVGVLALVLILAIAMGTGNPPPPKEMDRPAPPPIAAKQNLPIKTPPEPKKIDTSAAKMTVRLPELPVIAPPPGNLDVAGLVREIRGPFGAFPESPQSAPVLRVSRLMTPGPQAFRTLGEAFGATKENEFTVIEIADSGPIFVPNVPSLSRRTILLRGGDGHRPLIVWDVPNRAAPDKTPSALCTLAQGKLILEKADLVARWTSNSPGAIFDLPETDFYARECTFSLTGKSKDGFALVQRTRTQKTEGGRAAQTWFKRCFVRGPNASLVRSHETAAEVLLDESLVVVDQHPIFDLRGKTLDAFNLSCMRSSLIAGQVMLRWQSMGGASVDAPIAVKMLDSIVSCDDITSSQGDMVQIVDGGLSVMRWRGVNCVYAGWKQLAKSDSKSIGGTDLAGWQAQVGNPAGEQAMGERWPASPPSGLEEQPASTFLPGEAPVAHVALGGAGSIGAVVGWLPPAPEEWLQRTYEQRVLAGVPFADPEPPAIPLAKDNLYHGERIDLSKGGDLGAYLSGVLHREKDRLAPRIVVRITGRGPTPTSPIRFGDGRDVVLYFEHDLKDPITLEPNAEAALKRVPLVEIVGGKLEIIGARMRLSAGTLVPALIRGEDANLTLTRCTLQGPHVKANDGFSSLVTISGQSAGPTTLLLRDNVMIAAKLLIDVQNHAQLRARNNIFLALTDGIQFDVRSLTAPLVHVLDHNTLAAKNTFVALRTGLEPSVPGSVLVHANSNAFLFPFSSDADTSALVRGIDAWTLRGRFAWQGRNNVFDARMHAFVGQSERAVVARQTRFEWQTIWGQLGEQDALLLADPKTFKTITVDVGAPSAVLPQLDRLALPGELRGDRSQPPPGADLTMLLGLKKK